MKKIYYGWVVCILCTLIIFVTMGAVSNGFAIYMPYIMNEQGFAFSQTSFLITLRCLVALAAMFCIGVFYDKLSLRVGIAIAVACSAAAYFIYGVADNYIMFGIGAAVSGLSYGLGSMIPVTILISQWFISHRALALGICTSGSGIASILLSPVNTMLVENYSLRTAFLAEGSVWLVIAAVALAFIRNKPSEMGLRPYGQKELQDKVVSEGMKGKVVSFSLSERGWILMGCVSLSMGAVANPGFSHLPVLLTAEGFSSVVVASVISGIGIVITVSKVAFGELADKIGGMKSSVLAFIVLIAGHVLCCFSFLQSIPVCVATVVVIGLGYPIATIGPSLWAGDMVSADKFPEVVRKFQITYACGALLFSNIPGILADHFNGYIPAYILFSGLIFISMVFLMIAYKENRSSRNHE